MNINDSKTELLTVEQFALCFQVSRATVFNWMKLGVLKEGCDYFRIGRVLRFVWSEEQLNQLLRCSVDDAQDRAQVKAEVKVKAKDVIPSKPFVQKLQQKKYKFINLDL